MTKMQMVFDAIAAGNNDRPAIVKVTGLTAAEVQSALQNLRYTRRINLVAIKSAGRQLGRIPGEYEINTANIQPVQVVVTVRKPVSVFDFYA